MAAGAGWKCLFTGIEQTQQGGGKMITRNLTRKRFGVLLIFILLSLLAAFCARSTSKGPQSVTVNGVTLNYIEKGSGDEVIIFVHGFASAKGIWREILDLLPEKYHTYAIDQRGHGQSEKPGSYQLSEFVEDIYTFAQELGIKRFTYVGHSMGGKIGMKFALDHPDMLKALVLVCPAPPFAFPSDQVPAIQEGNKAMLATPESIRKYIEWEIDKRPVSEERKNDMVNDMSSIDTVAIEGCGDFLYSTDLMPQLGNIGIPTLVVGGAQDKSVPLDLIIKPTAEAIEGSRLKILDNSSHFLPIESPRELADVITRFIEDVNK
jgi:pimeloyl-ACP methyl ester carboxylesterase